MAACEYDKLMFEPHQWWNGQAHLALTIGTMALTHRDMGNTYPEHLTSVEWHDILTRIGEPLIAYARGIDDFHGSEERLAAAREAMSLFAEWFDKFWD